MKITVKDGKKDKIHIYLDGEYTATTNRDFWASCKYSSGDEITPSQWQELLEEIHFRKMYSRALDLLSMRDHSKRELSDKLYTKFSADGTDKEVIKQQINKVCERLEENGLLNDERFARLYTDELCRNKLLSSKALRTALYKKGIDREIIDNILEEVKTDPVETILELLRTQYGNRNLQLDVQRERTFASLSRKGFTYSDIKTAMYKYLDGEIDIDIGD